MPASAPQTIILPSLTIQTVNGSLAPTPPAINLILQQANYQAAFVEYWGFFQMPTAGLTSAIPTNYYQPYWSGPTYPNPLGEVNVLYVRNADAAARINVAIQGTVSGVSVGGFQAYTIIQLGPGGILFLVTPDIPGAGGLFNAGVGVNAGSPILLATNVPGSAAEILMAS